MLHGNRVRHECLDETDSHACAVNHPNIPEARPLLAGEVYVQGRLLVLLQLLKDPFFRAAEHADKIRPTSVDEVRALRAELHEPGPRMKEEALHALTERRDILV